MMTEGVGGHGFSDVDRTGRASDFVRYLDERGTQEFMRVVEQRIIDPLEVQPEPWTWM